MVDETEMIEYVKVIFVQELKAKEFISARDFAQYEGCTHINLIEQLQNLSLEGNGFTAKTPPPQEVYSNGVAGADDDHQDEDKGDESSPPSPDSLAISKRYHCCQA